MSFLSCSDQFLQPLCGEERLGLPNVEMLSDERWGWLNIYELLVLFSSLGELAFDEADVDEDDEEEEEEKSLSAESRVEFCPVRLSLHTGHVSCCWQQ